MSAPARSRFALFGAGCGCVTCAAYSVLMAGGLVSNMMTAVLSIGLASVLATVIVSISFL